MESLPKPLIVLIGSIIKEYEHCTWNSTYLGDKMRISLVWTRGELINRNNGKKHKSPSKIERDNRRSDTWHEKQESNKIESEKLTNLSIVKVQKWKQNRKMNI